MICIICNMHLIWIETTSHRARELRHSQHPSQTWEGHADQPHALLGHDVQGGLRPEARSHGSGNPNISTWKDRWMIPETSPIWQYPNAMQHSVIFDPDYTPAHTSESGDGDSSVGQKVCPPASLPSGCQGLQPSHGSASPTNRRRPASRLPAQVGPSDQRRPTRPADSPEREFKGMILSNLEKTD